MTTRLDPSIALADTQRLRLAQADPRDADGVLRLSGALTLDQLDGAATFVNARTVLAALDEAPVRATKELGNLELRFVARMLDELQLDAEARERIRYVSRRPQEEDVRDLHMLRVVLQLAGLVKKRSGHFSITQRGRQLLSPDKAAGLFETLLRTYFGKFNIFYVYGCRQDRQLQRRIVLAFWTIRRLAEHPVDGARIAALMPRDGATWSPHDGYVEDSPEEYEVAVSHVVLEPLRGFGLLGGGEPVGKWPSRKRAPWQVTPLFDAAISFDLAEDVMAGADAGPSTTSVARLLVTLQSVEPAVWRRLEVLATSTFDQLHRYINAAMGWLDYHLHEFRVGRRRIAASDADWETEWPHEDETQVTLGESLADGVRTFRYHYDFGDDWEHLVEVEHVGPPEQGVFYPRCVAAAGACPPEDCGGPHGYLELLEALADPEDPEHAELLQWLEEPLDPGYVDVEGIDRLLRLAATGEIRPDDLDYFSGK